MRPSGVTTLSIAAISLMTTSILYYISTHDLTFYTVILKFVWLSVTMKNAIIFSVVMSTFKTLSVMTLKVKQNFVILSVIMPSVFMLRIF